MGVVRREGDWRLEKRGNGIYEITYQKEVELRVYTADATARERQGFDTVPIEEVQDFHDVEKLFEDEVRRGNPTPIEDVIGEPAEVDRGGGNGESPELDLENVPPGALAVVLTIVGSFSLLSIYPTTSNTFVLGIGLLMTGGGLAIFVYAVLLLSDDGWGEARDFLLTPASEK